MSNQEPQNQGKTKEEADVQKRRRFIKVAGVAAPVVLTLANRSAFGQAQPCLSQQISGNMSQIGQGSCESGMSPLEWKGPNQLGTNITDFTEVSTVGPTTDKIDKEVEATFASSDLRGDRIRIISETVTTIKTYKWYGTNFIYGILTTTERNTSSITRISDGTSIMTEVMVTNPDPNPAGSPNIGAIISGQKFIVGERSEYTGSNPLTTWSGIIPPAPKCSDYTGGTTFIAAFGYGSMNPMREFLCKLDNPNVNSANKLNAYRVTAMLNASYDAPAINYVLTVDQVKAVSATPPTCPIPGDDLSTFLRSTWLNRD